MINGALSCPFDKKHSFLRYFLIETDILVVILQHTKLVCFLPDKHLSQKSWLRVFFMIIANSIKIGSVLSFSSQTFQFSEDYRDLSELNRYLMVMVC